MSYVMDMTSEGGEVEFESLGIRAVFPSNTVPRGTTQLIKVSVFAQLSDYISVRADEVLGTSGIQFLPDGLQLNSPMKIIIPHCTSLSACREVIPVLYSGDEKRGNIILLMVSQDKKKSTPFYLKGK